MTIYEALEAIKSSVYGKDMRAAIYDAIKELNNRSSLSVELTQAEYDLLPVEEKYNGNEYFITDKGLIIKNDIQYGGGGGGMASSLKAKPRSVTTTEYGTITEINQ